MRGAVGGVIVGAVLVLVVFALIGEFRAWREATDPGPAPQAGAPGAAQSAARREAPVRSKPAVLRAARSVVFLRGSCGGRAYAGTGWIAAPGVIVTNAHVVAGQRDTTAQVRGRGPIVPATAIWFDRANDIALLRAPRLAGVPRLRLGDPPALGTPAAVIGFPRGGPLRRFHARMYRMLAIRERSRAGERVPSSRPRAGSMLLYARVLPGNSGSPVVGGDGRVLGTLRSARGSFALAVPSEPVRVALGQASKRVDTGGCLPD